MCCTGLEVAQHLAALLPLLMQSVPVSEEPQPHPLCSEVLSVVSSS